MNFDLKTLIHVVGNPVKLLMFPKQPSVTICCPLVPEKNVYEFLRCNIVIVAQNCSNKNHPDTVCRSHLYWKFQSVFHAWQELLANKYLQKCTIGSYFMAWLLKNRWLASFCVCRTRNWKQIYEVKITEKKTWFYKPVNFIF